MGGGSQERVGGWVAEVGGWGKKGRSQGPREQGNEETEKQGMREPGVGVVNRESRIVGRKLWTVDRNGPGISLTD